MYGCREYQFLSFCSQSQPAKNLRTLNTNLISSKRLLIFFISQLSVGTEILKFSQGCLWLASQESAHSIFSHPRFTTSFFRSLCLALFILSTRFLSLYFFLFVLPWSFFPLLFVFSHFLFHFFTFYSLLSNLPILFLRHTTCNTCLFLSASVLYLSHFVHLSV